MYKLKVLLRVLEFARIEKRDTRGRTVWPRSLWHKFVTLLGMRGTQPRVVQVLVRRSTMEMTMTA